MNCRHNALLNETFAQKSRKPRGSTWAVLLTFLVCLLTRYWGVFRLLGRDFCMGRTMAESTKENWSPSSFFLPKGLLPPLQQVHIHLRCLCLLLVLLLALLVSRDDLGYESVVQRSREPEQTKHESILVALSASEVGTVLLSLNEQQLPGIPLGTFAPAWSS
jgi:hypothetical protein